MSQYKLNIIAVLLLFVIVLPSVYAGSSPGVIDQVNYTILADNGGLVGNRIGNVGENVTVVPGQRMYVIFQIDSSAGVVKKVAHGVDWMVVGGSFADSLEIGASSSTDWEFFDGEYAELDQNPPYPNITGSVEALYFEGQKNTQDGEELSNTVNEIWFSLEAPTVEADYELVYVRTSKDIDGASILPNVRTTHGFVTVAAPNVAPDITDIAASHSLILGGDTITIYANTTSNGVNDSDGDELFLYCDSTATPDSGNTDCTGGTLSDTSSPYVLTCTFAVPTDDTSHTEYCRVYDGTEYSSTVPNIVYTTDSTNPQINFTPSTTAAGSYAQDYIFSNVSASDTNLGSIIIRLFNSTGLFNSFIGSFFNFTSLADGFYYLNATANDSVGNENVTETRSFILDNTNPSVLFNFQDPSDVDTFNIFSYHLNISYNISDNVALNTSSVKLYYKVNSSSGSYVYVNGTQVITNDFFTGLVDISNASDVWYFELEDHNVYPATYNFNEEEMGNTVHSFYDLNDGKDMMKVRLFNVSNQKEYSIFEVMVNNSEATGTKALRIYYCNSSYVSGKPKDSDFCVNFYNLPAQTDYNHTHSAYSSHQTIPFALNSTTGEIGGIYVTNTSYFILRGEKNQNSFDLYYIDNISRADSIQLSTNEGGAWSNFSGTIDAHLHQYDGSEKFYYYACANDTTGNENCSDIRSDVFNLTDMPPMSPSVYAPVEGTYSGDVNINYSVSVSPNGYDISFYNISLVDVNDTFVQNIVSNNSLNLSYVWDSSEAIDGEYEIRVEACDNHSQCSFGYSDNITIDNSAPALEIVSPMNTNYTNVTILLNISSDGLLVWYNWNGTNVTYGSALNVAFDEGPNTLIAYANDSAGNLNVTNVNFSVDSIAPVVTNPTTIPSLPIINDGDAQNFSVNFTSSEYPVNLTFNLYNSTGDVINTIGPTQLDSSSDLPVNYSIPDTLDEGVYYLNMTVEDSVGNSVVTALGNFTVDSIAPVITILSPQSIFYDTASIDLNVSADEVIDTWWYTNNSGVTNVTFSPNITITGIEGSNVFVIYANDSAGNLNFTNVSFSVDSIAPLIEFVEPTTNTTNRSLDYIVGNVTSSDLNLNTTVIYLYNSSGLVNSSVDYFVNFTDLVDGTYYLNASANDSVGNVNSTETRTITIDTTPPIIYIHSPLNDSYNNATILLNISSDGDNVWYNWTGTNVTYIGEVNVTFAEDVNVLYVWANDSLGNLNSTNVTFFVDSIAPSVDIVSPLNQSYTNATVLINISSDGDDVWYNWNGTNYTYSGVVNVTFVEGLNTLYVYANDSVGNLNVTNVTFVIDLTSPVVSLISPINGSTVTASLTVDFEYNVTDNSSIENCSLIINDVFNSVDTVIAKDVTQSIVVVLVNGDYNWSVNCTDEVGNENSSDVENFTLAYVAPVTPTGGGGGGSYAGAILECIDDSGCGEEQYCSDNKCFDFECDSDLDCNDTKTCWMRRCVKLFDMKIEDVDSPILPGESFGFTYFLKGVAEIHGDVTVNFWLEKDGEIVTEGFDTIYMADFDEKTETTELFLPASIAPGTYNFYAEVSYDSYYARALRVIEVVEVPEEPGAGVLTGRAIANVGDVIKTNVSFILVVLGILVLFGIVYWERREIRKILYPEARWVNRHKISIGTFLFFVVLVGVLFYADRADMIKLSPLRMSLVKYLYIAGLVAVLAIVLARVRIRNLFGHLGRFVKSLFGRKRGLEVRERVSVKPKVMKVKPKVRKMEVKPKVSPVKVRPKVVKKKVVRRKKRKPRAKSLLEKSHPKLFKELKEPKVKLKPTKVEPMKESSSADRELERAKSMKDKISSIGKKRVVKNSHPNIKKEVKEIKSAMSRSK